MSDVVDDANRDVGAEFELEGLEPAFADAVRLILRIVGGDLHARGVVSGTGDGLDAVVVALNMLAESFQRERNARERAETLLADAVDAYDHAPDLFCSCEIGTMKVVKCNETMAQALGRPASAILGRSLVDFATTASRGLLDGALGSLVATGTLKSTEVVMERAGGSPLVVSLTGSVKRDAANRPERLRLVLRDVTVERQLEHQLQHAQRMEAIGRLAGGVAHDFNNLLLVIQSSADMLARRVAGRAAEVAEVTLIQEASDRAAALTRDLLAFSRRERAQAQWVCVDSVIERTQPIFERLLSTQIRLDVDLAAAKALVSIDPARLEQALVNVIVNSRDAMPEGGTVSIRSRVVEIRSTDVDRPADLGDGVFVEISVEDTGHGVDPAVMSKIFEPFFTTKPVGKGTGLGLSTVYGTVRQAGGTVSARSELGRGTVVSMLLPVRRDAQSAPASTTESPPTLVLRGRSVLLVEDDDRVRAVTSRILTTAGYVVHEAASGREALRIAGARETPIDLVLSDVTMPEMSGPETVRALREIRPMLPCVYVTGHMHEAGNGLEQSEDYVLEKPFVPTALLNAVRVALEPP